MTDPSKDPGLIEIWRQISTYIKVLALTGLAGAFLKTLVDPEPGLTRMVVQVVVGMATAVFLGGYISTVVNSISDAGVYTVLASGFLSGWGGVQTIKAVQEKVYGKR